MPVFRHIFGGSRVAANFDFWQKAKKSSKKQSESAFLTNNPALFWNNLA
jgi:hypothetical protein